MAKTKQNNQTKQSAFVYGLLRFCSWFIAKLVFRRKIVNNPIRNKKGPFVILANHQCALDFVNLIGISKKRMRFVISKSFYESLSVQPLLKKAGVIPKQQFQSSVTDLKKMKAVIDAGEILVIFPTGLMCEDGLPTPTPQSTYKFLQWLKTDVYVAKTEGSYFVMPKWSKGFRRGKTLVEVFKLFDGESIDSLSLAEIKQKTDLSLNFDCYREQEKNKFIYKNNDNVEGLEHVLYKCPHCNSEFSIAVKDKSTLFCQNCGFSQTADKYGFLHKTGDIGEEIRYVSDWSKLIYDGVVDSAKEGKYQPLTAFAKIQMIDKKKRKFVPVGDGSITLYPEKFVISGVINGEKATIDAPTLSFASLPFKPGKYLEIQRGDKIYRCVLDDGKMVMKFINQVKAFYQLSCPSIE